MKLFWKLFTVIFPIGFLSFVAYILFYVAQVDFGWMIAVIVVLYIGNSIITMILFAQRRQHVAKISWLVVMSLLPVVGHVLFIVYGQRYKHRQSLNKYQSKESFKHEILTTDTLQIEKSTEGVFQNQRLASKRGVYRCDMEILSSGERIFSELFKDLEKAKKFIHLHYYIIKPGEIYEHLKAILLKKVKEGVEVRFIIDDFGRFAMPWHEINSLEKNGVMVKIFNRVFFPFIASRNGYRSHRKMALIDGNVVHTGGINIADEYASLNKKYGLWMDYNVRITGKVVRSFSLLFIEDWFNLTKLQLPFNKYLLESDSGKSQAILVEDSPELEMPLLRDAIVRWIANAKKTITISTPYFIPTPEVLSALRTAAMGGVKIKIFIPGHADKQYIYIASRYWARRLVKYGVEFYEVKDIMNHSKMGIFDQNYAYLGTANLDMRSFYSQLEIMSLVTGPVIKDIKNLFSDYELLSRRITKESLEVKGLKEKSLRIFSNLFAPLM